MSIVHVDPYWSSRNDYWFGDTSSVAIRGTPAKVFDAAAEAGRESVGPLAYKSCESRIDLVTGAGVEDLDFSPVVRAAVATSFKVDSVLVALAGLTSTATRAAAGTSSRKRSSRLAPTSAVRKLIPVALPPSRARLATRPSLTGSSLTAKMMGIVVVAALSAGPPLVAITSTRR